ncbi:hypothetical protein Tco_1311822 [Tanacetum coccineum]
MSTSKTYQQSLADAGSETRPPMLERGSYIPWASRFRRYINRKRENRKWLNKALDEGPYQFEMFIPNNSTVPKLQTAEDLQGDALLHYDAEMELMNLILLSIPNDIYNSVDACTLAKDMWKRVERLMRGTIQNKVDRETRFAQGQRIKGEDQLDWGPRQIKGQDGAWFPLTAKTQQTQEREGKELPAYKEKNEDREKYITRSRLI